MAQPPPRPAASRAGPASPGASPGSGSGPRAKEGDNQPATFFLGRYRVVDEIGVGGMASVHLARMDGPGGFQKWVAIKRIHPHLVEDDQFVDMFLDEARIAAGINHANVAQVFDLGKDDNTYWIAMEYLHGEPLREVMRRAEERGQRIGPELAARICADAAEGLHAAHELRGKNGQLLGLVHRDVTPHNLFLTYDGYTKVVDFGIAKVADRLASTRAGTLKGKLAYMSPEQVRGAEVDRTTDIFALGVVLWEITTNQRLFRMDTDLDTLEKVQACQVPPPSTIVPGYPPELEQVVLKALAKRKQDRYQTAREFSRALQTFLVRSGHFVGPEEVAQFVRTVFADRIQKREAHLAWAAEVTSTVNVDKIRGGGKGARAPGRRPPSGKSSSASRASPPRPQQRQSANGEQQKAAAAQAQQQMASQSLMDDDEDVPTTVAMREQLEAAVRNATAPRPAAGLPAPPPPHSPATAARPPLDGGGPRQASYAAPSPSYAANATYAANAAQQQRGGYPQNNAPPPPYGQPPEQPLRPVAVRRPAAGRAHRRDAVAQRRISDPPWRCPPPSTSARAPGPPTASSSAAPAGWGHAGQGPNGQGQGYAPQFASAGRGLAVVRQPAAQPDGHGGRRADEPAAAHAPGARPAPVADRDGPLAAAPRPGRALARAAGEAAGRAPPHGRADRRRGADGALRDRHRHPPVPQAPQAPRGGGEPRRERVRGRGLGDERDARGVRGASTADAAPSASASGAPSARPLRRRRPAARATSAT